MPLRHAASKLRLLLILAFVSTSCSTAVLVEKTTNGWKTADLEEVGLKADILANLVELVNDGTYQNVHSIVIARDGKLVFEQYFPGYSWNFYEENFQGELTDFDPEELHNQASVTKSFTSTLIGIAIDKGFINGVDDKLFNYFPEYAHLADDRKNSITIEHLLTMTAGLEWNGLDVPINTRDPANDVLQLFLVDDPLEFILSKPMVSEPGTDWYYNGGATVLLGEILRRASGQGMDAFAEQHLFGPLGITEYDWFFIQPDLIYASGNLRMRPRDMAKLGQLFLNEGKWTGEQIVSEQWIEDAVETHSIPRWADGYGYQWWIESSVSGSHSYNSFYASGWGGQRILVFPQLDMVIVLTGGNYTRADSIKEIIEDHLLPAVQG